MAKPDLEDGLRVGLDRGGLGAGPRGLEVWGSGAWVPPGRTGGGAWGVAWGLGRGLGAWQGRLGEGPGAGAGPGAQGRGLGGARAETAARSLAPDRSHPCAAVRVLSSS